MSPDRNSPFGFAGARAAKNLSSAGARSCASSMTKVATPFVSTAHYSLLFTLNHEHVDATKVNILNLQPPEIAAACARGDIDAANVWARTGKSVFFITRGIDQAVFMATRLVVMSPSPDRVAASLELDFAKTYFGGASARDIEASPEFIATRDRVRELVFANRRSAAAAAACATRPPQGCCLHRRRRGALVGAGGAGGSRAGDVPALAARRRARDRSVWSEGFQDATLPQHALASLGRVSAALVAAVLVGVPLEFAVNLSPTARGIVEPLLEIYRPIPPLAYLPLVIIWFGIGEFAKILVIFLGALPSLLIATDEGLRSVSADRVNAARSLGATRAQVVLRVWLPHALPNILTGARIGLGTGWATLIAAEPVATTRGLGFMIKGAADFLVTDVVILGILGIAALAIAMELGQRLLQRNLTPWQGRE